MGQLGETREVECDEVPASPTVASRLDVRDGSRVTRVRRLRANNGALNTFIVDYLPLDIGRRFDAQSLRVHSLVQLLDEEPDLRLHTGRQLISARSATRYVARKFNVEVGTPILFVERDLQIVGVDDLPVVLQRLHSRRLLERRDPPLRGRSTGTTGDIASGSPRLSSPVLTSP